MAGENPAYISAIHDLPCRVCTKYGMVQTSPTEAHHTICGRYGNTRTHDEQAIPLCMCHHQGDWHDHDKNKLAIHRGKQSWVSRYGPDTDYIEDTQKQLAKFMAAPDAPTQQRKPRKPRKSAVKSRGFEKGRPIPKGQGFPKGRGFGPQKSTLATRKKKA